MARFSVGEVLASVENNSVLRQWLVVEVISEVRITVLPYGDDGFIIHRPRTLEGSSLNELCVDAVATRLLARIKGMQDAARIAQLAAAKVPTEGSSTRPH